MFEQLMDTLGYFGFVAKWSPYFMLFIVAVAAAYLAVVGPYRNKFANSEPVSSKQKLYFLSGLLLIYIAQGSPIDLLGHLMFSAHMISMSIAFLIAPPLIWLGTPGWLLRPVVERVFKSKWKRLIHPLVTLLMFNALFSFYHIPFIHDAVMTNYTLHTIYYMVLYFAAFLMWWPIATPLQEFSQMSYLQKLGYMFAAGVLLTPACALIIFAGKSVFSVYTDAQMWVVSIGYCLPGNTALDLLKLVDGPEVFHLVDPVHDQQAGGVIMKLTQEIMYGFILAYIFRRWFYSENRRNAEVDPIPDEDLTLNEGQLNRA